MTHYGGTDKVKKQKSCIALIVSCLVVLSGCAGIQKIFSGGGKNGKPPQKTQVLCTYFHYFGGETHNFAQWEYYDPRKDPYENLGPEPWRRNIWIGRTGDYPYIGPYNNIDDAEVMRWHMQLAKASGISAFLLFINNWEHEDPRTRLLLDVAQEEDFKIGLIEQKGPLGVRALSRSSRNIQERSLNWYKEKYEGYERLTEEHSRRLSAPSPDGTDPAESPKDTRSRDVPSQEIEQAITRMSQMMNAYKSHPAYLRVDNKPLLVIPYMVLELSPLNFTHLVAQVRARVGELYIVGIVPGVYWYFQPESMKKTGLTPGWANAGVDAFTHWTPNGMVNAKKSVIRDVMEFHVIDSKNHGKDAIIPVMPGFEITDWGGPAQMTVPRNNGAGWKTQLEAAFSVRPRFIFIQSWNEWHEGAQIEPSTLYRDLSTGNSDPYLYLRILADTLKKTWQAPPLPPASSIDSLRHGTF